jgi:hypothetical protein
MKAIFAGLVLCLMLGGPAPAGEMPAPRPPAPPILGVNETNLAWRPAVERAATLRAIRAAGFTTIRLTWRRPLEGSFDLFEIARREGLGIVLDIPAVTGETARPGALERPGRGDFGARYGLSQLDPDRLGEELQRISVGLARHRPRIVAIEFANEANWADFNGDLPLLQPGQVWRRLEDMPEPHRSDFTAGLLRYREAVRRLTAWRDATPALRGVPVITGGLADANAAFVVGAGASIVTEDEMLRQLGRLGILDRVDGVGVHPYEPLYAFARGEAGEGRRLTEAAVAPCGTALTARKPCWITEFGASLPPSDCALDADPRGRAIEAFLSALAATKAPVAAVIYYNWSQSPDSALQRCGRASSAVQSLTQHPYVRGGGEN